jgi:hypothetical protein
MRRIVFVLVAAVALAGVVADIAPASGQSDGEAAPIFGVRIPPGYRDWRLISVAHEEGNLNDLPAILGNDVAIEEQQRTGRMFGSMDERELAEILQRHGWELLGPSPL